MYEHPAKHRRGICGIIELSEAGVYVLKVGGCRMSCPQDWAAKIHKTEEDRVRIVRCGETYEAKTGDVVTVEDGGACSTFYTSKHEEEK
jgi:hypothetical protein